MSHFRDGDGKGLHFGKMDRDDILFKDIFRSEGSGKRAIM